MLVVVLNNLSDESLKCQLRNERVCWLLKLSDFSQSYSPWTKSMWALDTSWCNEQTIIHNMKNVTILCCFLFWLFVSRIINVICCSSFNKQEISPHKTKNLPNPPPRLLRTVSESDVSDSGLMFRALMLRIDASLSNVARCITLVGPHDFDAVCFVRAMSVCSVNQERNQKKEVLI